MTNGIQGGCWRQRWTRMWKGGHRQTRNIVTRMWQMLDKDRTRRRWTSMWQERGGLKCDKEEVDKEMTRRRWTRMWQGGKGEEAKWELRGSSPWTQLSVRREKGFLVGGDKTTKPHFKANLNFIPDEKNRQYQRIHPLYTFAQSRGQREEPDYLENKIRRIHQQSFQWANVESWLQFSVGQLFCGFHYLVQIDPARARPKLKANRISCSWFLAGAMTFLLARTLVAATMAMTSSRLYNDNGSF